MSGWTACTRSEALATKSRMTRHRKVSHAVSNSSGSLSRKMWPGSVKTGQRSGSHPRKAEKARRPASV